MLTPLQERLTEMLGFFHSFCQKENLRYYVLGGTALGVERHGGFIPWDDDIDVGLPRPDYDRLRALVSGKTFGNYVFEFPNKGNRYVYAFAKMYDTTTTLIESTRFNIRRGVYIDVFPIDGVGDTYEDSLVYFRKADRITNLHSTLVCALKSGRKLYKNLAVLMMRCVPPFILNPEKTFRRIDSVSRGRDFDSSEYVAVIVGNWHEKEIIPRRLFGTPAERSFGNIKVMAPENMDEYLTCLYGDWRRLPPPEKRVTHHSFKEIALNRAYLTKCKSNESI